MDELKDGVVSDAGNENKVERKTESGDTGGTQKSKRRKRKTGEGGNTDTSKTGGTDTRTDGTDTRTEINTETTQGNPVPVVLDPSIFVEAPPVTKKLSKKQREELALKTSTENLTYIIEGIFSLIALKAGEHWNLSPGEADTIANPTARILERMGKLENVNKNMDYVMLVGACMLITIPRLMISSQLSEQRKRKVIQIEQHKQERQTNTNSGSNTTTNQTPDGDNLKTALGILPS